MNISLSWADYALIIGACLIGYYLVIGFVFYRKDLWQLFKPKRERAASFAQNQQPAATGVKSIQHTSLPDGAFLDSTEIDEEAQTSQPTIEDFLDEVDACTQACGNGVTKEELSINLRKILHKYPSLASSSLRGVLSGIIATASQNNCSIQWREDELNEWWNG